MSLDEQKNKLMYVVVPEFQKRGAVHYHVIFFNLPFLENIHSVLTSLWQKGHIFGKSIKDINHLANYVSKYIQKEFDEKHTKYSKRYFSSRGLQCPLVLRNKDQAEYILAQIDPKSCKIERSSFITPQNVNIEQATLIFPDGVDTKKFIF